MLHQNQSETSDRLEPAPRLTHHTPLSTKRCLTAAVSGKDQKVSEVVSLPMTSQQSEI